jgi:hypothetical protein
MLQWNAQKVSNLTPVEIWLFILGRVLVAFAIGVIAARNFPRVAEPAAVAAMIVGAVMLGIALRGLARKASN